MILTILILSVQLISGSDRISIPLCDGDIQRTLKLDSLKMVTFKRSSPKFTNIFSPVSINITSSKTFTVVTQDGDTNDWKSYLQSLLLRREQSEDEKQYHQQVSCFTDVSVNISQESSDTHVYIKVGNQDFDRSSLFFFIMGCLLFVNARYLTRSASFLYTSCASLGVLTSFLIVLIILFKLLPYKRPMSLLLFAGSGVWCYFVQHMKSSILNLIGAYPYVFACYCIFSAIVSVSLLYYFGLPSNEKSLNLLQWFLQLISMYVIYTSCYSKQFSITIIIMLLILQFVSFYYMVTMLLQIILPRRLVAWYYRPKKRHLLTLEEYEQQGVHETQLALKELSQYCSSPKCNSWDVVSRLKDPKRFASFLKSSTQFTPEEINSYDNEDFDHLINSSIEMDEKRPRDNRQLVDHKWMNGDIICINESNENPDNTWITDDEIENRCYSDEMIRCVRSLYTTVLNMQRKLDKTSRDVQMILRDDVNFLCGIFLKDGYDIRVVGGAVRDILKKEKPKDIDMSTTATPQQMKKVFEDNNVRYIETGIQHGTLTAHLENADYEITTLRVDVETFGRAARVEFTNDWRLDAERRDLTVNAMSLDIDGHLYDYFGGELDLQKGNVRFVGDSRQRICEDYLRILRYFRFYGRIAAHIDNHDKKTLQIIKENASGLQHIAKERIWLEVSKIFVGNYAPHILKLLYQLDVSDNISLPNCREKHFIEFENVWKRTRPVYNDVLPVTLFAALVDDEHQAEKICGLWKLSNMEKTLCCFIVKHRYMQQSIHHPLKPYKDILVRRCNAKNTHIIRQQVSQLLYYEGKVKEWHELREWIIPKFPISGNDLIKQNIKKGPEFGKVLNTLKDMWIASDFTLSKDFLYDEITRVYDTFKSIR